VAADSSFLPYKPDWDLFLIGVGLFPATRAVVKSLFSLKEGTAPVNPYRPYQLYNRPIALSVMYVIILAKRTLQTNYENYEFKNLSPRC
jgi:hypothetical protein